MKPWNSFKLFRSALALVACWAIGVMRAGDVGSKPDALSTDRLPAGLQPGAWARVLEQIQADQLTGHQTRQETGGREWHLSNRLHDLAARFDGVGLELRSRQTGQDGWRLRMEFAGYGRAPAPVAGSQMREQMFLPGMTEVVAVSNRVEYRRGPVTEWWRNQPTGLGHGFTLSEPPPSEPSPGPLRLQLALRDGLRARPVDDQSVALADASGSVLRYGGLKVWDATGRTLPARLQVVAEGAQVEIIVDDAHANYPLEVDPTFTQSRKLTANDGGLNDHFGYAVAVSGDVVVVGAQDDDIGVNSDQGSVYVFERNTGGINNWGLVKKRTASDGAAGDDFGYSVSGSGDVVVVGAPVDDVGANSNQGSVYVFERNTGGINNWGQVKKLTASDGAGGDQFGYSVGVSGDVVVVGAPVDDDFRGAGYVFERNAGGANNWGLVKKLIASDGQAGDQLGYSSAASADTVVLGAPVDDVGVNFNQGSAYVFERNTGGPDNWGEIKQLTASDGAGGDQLGYAVAVSGDVVVVGAPVDDVGANFDQGSAYVFERNTGGPDNWGEVKQLTASDGAPTDWFGFFVAVSVEVVVVGAPQDDVANPDQGSAYLFERDSGGPSNWGETQKLIAPDGAFNDGFGFAVGVSGDVVVAGAVLGNVGPSSDQGSAYVFGPPPPYPVILQQPQSRTNLVGATAAFDVITSGTEPLSYQWHKDNVALVNGGRVSGATTPNLVLSNVQLADAAAYAIVVSNSFGSVTSQVAMLQVIDVGNAVDATNLVWTAGGSATWINQSGVTHDGVDAARSGAILHNQESWLQTTATGPGTLAFWWKVSSEMDFDGLEFSIDDTTQRLISGEEDWERVSFMISAGTHTVQWRYAKDESVALGQDRGWLDEVVFIADAGSPVILAQPVSRAAGLNDTVTFVAGVAGATPRTYQWYYNQTNPIDGATNVTLALANVQLADTGVYHLFVSNPDGSTTSGNAILNVTTNGPVERVLLLGNPSFSSLFRTALDNLGVPYQAFGNYSAFNAAVVSANPATTLVVVDVPDANAVLNPVARFANAGGRAILQYWALSVDSALAAAFHARVVPPLLTTPRPVYDWGGSPFFAGLTIPLNLVDRLVHDGEMLEPIARGGAVAGYTGTPSVNQAAVVIGHSGRTIINGFMLVEISAANGAVRFAQNQIEFLLPPNIQLFSPRVMAGQFQVMLSGRAGVACSLQASSDLIHWTAVTNVTLLAGSMPITVPASANQSFYRAVTPPVP